MKNWIDYIWVWTGAIIFNNENKVLITKRGKDSKNEVGKWEFPGGTVEFGERCEDTIKREVKEDLDIDIEVIELVWVVNHIIKDEKQHWVSPVYKSKYISGKEKIMEPWKMEAFEWIYIENIVEDILSIASKESLRMYKEKYGI